MQRDHRVSEWKLDPTIPFLTKRNVKFKRVDLAIDHFTASEVDIYDLEKCAKNKYWSGSFQSLKVISDMSFRGGIFSRGFSLTFGSEGSTQLQIYDKNLERRSKNEETFNTDKWYRYEMRLVDDKADNCVAEYLKIMKLIDEDQYALAGDIRHGDIVLSHRVQRGAERRGRSCSTLADS
jgi:DNA relaxase NicK